MAKTMQTIAVVVILMSRIKKLRFAAPTANERAVFSIGASELGPDRAFRFMD